MPPGSCVGQRERHFHYGSLECQKGGGGSAMAAAKEDHGHDLCNLSRVQKGSVGTYLLVRGIQRTQRAQSAGM